MASLGLLNVLVEEWQFVGDICGDLCVFVDVVVNEFLEQPLLHTRVVDEAVYQPGEKRAGGGKSSTRCNHQSPDETRFGQLFILAIGGTDCIVWLRLVPKNEEAKRRILTYQPCLMPAAQRPVEEGLQHLLAQHYG